MSIEFATKSVGATQNGAPAAAFDLEAIVKEGFVKQFPPKYTSILEMVPGSFESFGSSKRMTFRFTAKELSGSFMGTSIVKGTKTFVGVYKPGDQTLIIAPEVTYQLQSGPAK